MKNIFKFIIILFTFTILPMLTYASADFDAGDITVNKEIDGSGAYVGSNLKIQSKINGVLFAVGGTVEVGGTNEHALIVGGDLLIKSATTKDALILGNNIIFDSTSQFGRDVYLFGSNITLEGTFNREIKIVGDIVKLDKVTINGDIEIQANELTITENTIVVGNIKISDNAKTNISSDANIPNLSYYTSSWNQDISTLTVIKEKVFALMSIIILFVVTKAIFPGLYRLVLNKLENIEFNGYVSLFGMGFVSIIILPILAILAITSGIGFGLSIIVISLFILTITLSQVIFGYVIGELIIKKRFPKFDNELLTHILGIILLFVLTELPIIGGTIKFGIVLISFGLVAKLLVRQRKA